MNLTPLPIFPALSFFFRYNLIMDEPPLILPYDKYNYELVSNVHPLDWKNPEPAPMYNLVIIGAGTAGLVAAEVAASVGAKVALIEKRLIGGDCLNLGCVPSKTIISSSRVFEEVREAGSHGVKVICGAEADFPAVMERMRRLRARISRHDSAARFKDMGVDIFLGAGKFTGPHSAMVGETELKFKKALISTGARPFIPPVEGLSTAGYLTNENVFSLTVRPARFGVLGGGAIGCEMAQAFQRLGSRVTVLQRGRRLMETEDPDASAIIHEVFRREGIRVVLGDKKVTKIERRGAEKIIFLEGADGIIEELAVDEVLVSVGRAPNVDGLGLEAAGVEFDVRTGVKVDKHLRSTNRDIFAAGDVCLKFKFTHTANYAARVVVANALLSARRRFETRSIPWCTFTDPEVAHVGLCPEDGLEADTFRKDFSEIDRTVLEGEEDGFVKTHVKKGTDKILGATIVAKNAGDMIAEIALAMQGGIGLRKISETVHPYPTRAEAIKRVADDYMLSRLTPGIRRRLARRMERKRK
ncbi:MAG: mercuric reductase [Nitrospirota bacterium]